MSSLIPNINLKKKKNKEGIFIFIFNAFILLFYGSVKFLKA